MCLTSRVPVTWLIEYVRWDPEWRLRLGAGVLTSTFGVGEGRRAARDPGAGAVLVR